MIELVLFPVSFLLSYFGVEAYRRWSLRRQVFDVPNERSSHQEPIPRGGGLPIAAASLLLFCIYSALAGNRVAWGYLSGSILIAGISWLDDLYSIRIGWRLSAHSAAAVLVIADLGFFRSIYIPYFSSDLAIGMIGPILTFLWIVWMVNAYNFMDGIDGIAGLQAVVAFAGWSAFGVIFGDPAVYYYSGILLLSCFGFLLHNWQPAKIFMGDVGSAFLGFSFAAMPLLASGEQAEYLGILPTTAVFFVWFFFFDTLYTLVRRILRRERVWDGHRGHLYQRLVILGSSHKSVSLLYGMLGAISVIFALIYAVVRESFGIILVCMIVFLSVSLVFFANRKKKIDLTI